MTKSNDGLTRLLQARLQGERRVDRLDPFQTTAARSAGTAGRASTSSASATATSARAAGILRVALALRRVRQGAAAQHDTDRRRQEGRTMVHLLSHLDPMMYFMVIAFAIGFTVAAAVLVEVLPKPIDEPTAADADADAAGPTPPA
jgi:hypothetical protein